MTENSNYNVYGTSPRAEVPAACDASSVLGGICPGQPVRTLVSGVIFGAGLYKKEEKYE